jgi:hypothetical protein
MGLSGDVFQWFMTRVDGSTMARRQNRKLSRGKCGSVRKANRRTAPQPQENMRPSGKPEMAHAPLKEAVQAAKSQLTIIPFLRTYLRPTLFFSRT